MKLIRKENAQGVTPNFRHLLLGVALSTYILIVIGIIVRVTESGSACPDWPTCFGALNPPLGSEALVPYLHRLVAMVTGLLVISAVWYAFRRLRNLSLITKPLILALAVLTAQVILGGLNVIWNTPPQLAALHLGLALSVQGLVLVALVTAFAGPRLKRPALQLSFRSPFARLSLVTLAATFGLLVSGAAVAASHAAPVCTGWLFCDGSLVPADFLGWVNLAHRLATVSAGILVLALFIQAWRTQRTQTGILVATTAATVLFMSQALMGALEIAKSYPAYLLGLHVATAAAVWSALIIQVTLTGLAGRTAQEERLEAQTWAGRKGLLKDFLMLTKPIVVALLLVTTFAGMVVGAKAWPSARILFWTLLGGFMAAGGSGAINQYIDRRDDVKMQRTSRRPIPSGRMTPAEGLAFGVAIALASFYLMVAFVNFLAALLTLAGIIYYVLLYSIILKKTTVQNIVIGGGAGAIPPLVGWAAATGSLNIPSLFLFAVIFMWTPPHFWALALVRRKDYARAGVPMLPVIRGERETRWQIFLYTLELVALTLILPVFGLGGGIYLVCAAVLGAALIFSAWRVWRGEGNKVAWMMYRHSSMYLAFLFLALMIDALI